ncbi:aminoglycoside phosphotransferase family protein [Vibrio tubiashii]|uniref:phosphotransferase n=1 Tax=Vibrio tubiashii TaxID=29498 RepID=UPI001EFDFD83|nr:phosphotransferase [Vibrio tubiashii]MCG9579330.1 aminoglycoside phosphotransferase family protein [Vibrio tubiashii]
MQPEDQQLIDQESEISSLHILLDDSKMLALIRQYSPKVDIFSLTKAYIRYKPRTNCLVKYYVETTHGSTLYYAKAYTAKDVAKLENIKTGKKTKQLAPIVIKEHLMILYPFPLDAKLKVLPRLLEPGSLQKMLTRALYPKAQIHPHIQNIEILQYKPERRLVIKLLLTSGDVLVAKVYTGQRFKLANLSRRRKLYSQHLLDVVGRSSKHHLLVFRWIAGGSLPLYYNTKQLEVAPFYECGHYLGCFHRDSKAKRVVVKDTANFLHNLQRLSEDLALLVPKLKNRLNCLTSRLIEELHQLKADKAVIHGDFYAEQVLVTPAGNRIIDFDDVCYWYSAYDIGTFIAHLEFDSLCGNVPFARIAHYRQALLQGYSQILHPQNCEIELFTTVALLQLAHQPFRDAHPQWADSINHLIERCEQHYQSFKLLYDINKLERSILFSAELFDDPYARQMLLESIEGLSSADRLNRVTLTRYKKDKRALIEYEIERASGERLLIMGKVRLKSFDKRTWQINTTLFTNQFGPNSCDGIHVPQPLGCSPNHHIWFQRKVEGQNCFTLFCQRENELIPYRIAQALNKLHSAKIDTNRYHSHHDEILLLEEYLTKAAVHCPNMASDIQYILHNCKALAGGLRPIQAPTFIHRDFYHDQILINKTEVYLLDLDLACYGDPALDVGNFIAHIEEQCLRQFKQIHYAQHQIDQFVQHYLDISGLDLRKSIEIYALLSWARHIYISQRIPQRNDWTESIIEHCKQRLVDIRQL